MRKYNINLYLLIIFFALGVYFNILWAVNFYYITNYSNNNKYVNNIDFYIKSDLPGLKLYALKNETFKNLNIDISAYTSYMDKNYPNYNIINMIKLYNSLLLLNKSRIDANQFIAQIESTSKFHRYSESFTHIAIQAYAHNGNLNQFSNVLLDIFYRNIKYSLPFRLSRENVFLSIVKLNESGIGIDFQNKKLSVQLSEKHANYILQNSLEKYQCEESVDYFSKHLIPNFKIYYDTSVANKTQIKVSSGVHKSLIDLLSLCRPREFILD